MVCRGMLIMVMVTLAMFMEGCLSITSKEVEDICSTTLDPPFCVQALNSDSRTAGADLKGLAQISIGLTKSDATKTATLIASLVKKAKDAKLKGRYESCAENYDNSISSLEECKESVSSGDYVSLNFQASAAMDGPTTCLDGFEGPPEAPSQLSSKCQDSVHFCSIILAISKRLIG